MENEDEEDEIFMTRESGYDGQENVEEQDEEEEPEEEEPDTERKSSLDIPIPSRSLASRRSSLPCPAQLNAMHLSHLHAATMAHSPAYLCHQLESSETRPSSRSSHDSSNEEGAQAKTGTSDRRAPAIPTICEPLERKARFRSRNVMSLSDADNLCLICHDDLRKGRGPIRELHCSHSFHSECIEEWLWTKQTCPTCQKHVAMPEPLYWTSTRVIVP